MTMLLFEEVLSSYPLSPLRGERVRVRGDKKKLLATSLIVGAAREPPLR
jgi:hypothetical protein